MKMRIRGDSLRLRLTRGEVDTLHETGEVRETLQFGPGSDSLAYVLRRAAVEAPCATFRAGSVEVLLPTATADRWAQSEQVGIEAEQALPAGSLRLLIEKDFQCLAPRGEEDNDAFPHPKQASGAGC